MAVSANPPSEPTAPGVLFTPVAHPGTPAHNAAHTLTWERWQKLLKGPTTWWFNGNYIKAQSGTTTVVFNRQAGVKTSFEAKQPDYMARNVAKGGNYRIICKGQALDYIRRWGQTPVPPPVIPHLVAPAVKALPRVPIVVMPNPNVVGCLKWQNSVCVKYDPFWSGFRKAGGIPQ